MSIIRMKYPFLDEIAKYAKEHLPEEACGMIAGSEDENGRLITKVYYLTNTDHAEDHFTMDPKEQLAAIKDMRANGLKPLGNWHSHPSSPSRPSDKACIRSKCELHDNVAYGRKSCNQLVSYRGWTGHERGFTNIF